MILVDTSVWVDHFFRKNSILLDLLAEELVLMHPFVFGEIACGSLKQRSAILADLNALDRAESATHDETLALMQTRKLWAMGVGWIDVHLLASALLSGCQFWTSDLRLQKAASLAGVKLYERIH